ncbi:adenosylcobinamide-GDP ribazoletransferase, partial [Elusimicrobiota bacterium]
MGTVAVISVILVKAGLIQSIRNDLMAIALISSSLLSRWSMVLSFKYFRYARKEGRAKIFFDGTTALRMIITTVITLLVIYYFMGVSSIFLLMIIAAVTATFNVVVSKKLGGITGDTLGAINEVNEVVSLGLIILGAMIGIW